MYHIKFHDYVPEPIPATTDRIIAAHYYPAWKKGAAQVHDGFDDLAKEWPDRTPLMGYYDEENPEVCDWEIKWALEHGINCFIYCWYRNKENEGKPITVADLRCGHGIHEALFSARYQKLMKFAIMYEASAMWAGTDYTDMMENLMPFWMENYFSKENYLIIDNKPVLFIFSQARLALECFEKPEEQKRTFDACREYAKKFGFDGMIFAVCDSSPREERQPDYLARGYDMRFGYSSGYNSPYDFYSNEEDIINGQCDRLSKNLAIDNMRFVPTASCFCDPSPRAGQRWLDMGYDFRSWTNIWYLSPKGYREVLRRMKELCDRMPESSYARKLIMIDNWNEWDEGHFVAPSHKFGFQYLQAIREALTECDNLPDYRMPHDQGFENYNTSWTTADFSDFLKKTTP